MLVIVGYIVVLASVFGGFVISGGHLHSLLQPVELLMIGGAAVGAFVVGNNTKAIKATMKALPTCLKGSKYTKAVYMDLMALLYDILAKVRARDLWVADRNFCVRHFLLGVAARDGWWCRRIRRTMNGGRAPRCRWRITRCGRSSIRRRSRRGVLRSWRADGGLNDAQRVPGVRARLR